MCHEIFRLRIFHQVTSPGPNRHAQKRFRFFRIFVDLFVFVIDSPVVNTAGSFDSPVMNTPWSPDSPVMNTPRSRLLCVLCTSIRTALHKNFLVYSIIEKWAFTLQCVNHRGVLTTQLILHQQGSCVNQYRSTPGGEYTGESQLPVDEYTRSLDSPVVKIPGSRLWKQIIPWIFEKIRNPF